MVVVSFHVSFHGSCHFIKINPVDFLGGLLSVSLEDFCLLLLMTQYPETQLVQGRHSVNIYWLNFLHEAIGPERVSSCVFKNKSRIVDIQCGYTSYRKKDFIRSPHSRNQIQRTYRFPEGWQLNFNHQGQYISSD